MDNKAVDALSHWVTMLSVMSVKDTGFERLKEEYESCLEFRDSNENNYFVDGYHFYKGYLFRDNKFCIPKTFVLKFFIWEIYAGGLSGHYERNKTIEEVER